MKCTKLNVQQIRIISQYLTIPAAPVPDEGAASGGGHEATSGAGGGPEKTYRGGEEKTA